MSQISYMTYSSFHIVVWKWEHDTHPPGPQTDANGAPMLLTAVKCGGGGTENLTLNFFLFFLLFYLPFFLFTPILVLFFSTFFLFSFLSEVPLGWGGGLHANVSSKSYGLSFMVCGAKKVFSAVIWSVCMTSLTWKSNYNNTEVTFGIVSRLSRILVPSVTSFLPDYG